MYITNPENIPKSAIPVNGLIANYLMNEKKVPLLSKKKFDSGETIYYFADTFTVNLHLKELPFWMKLTRFY